MPESPEVEELAAVVADAVVGHAIERLELEEFRVLKTRDRTVAEMADAVVSEVRRYGKHLAFLTDGPTLVVSFGRAGWLRFEPSDLSGEPASGDAGAPEPAAASVPAPTVAALLFRGGPALAFTDAGSWLSLGLSIVGDPSEVAGIARLGPDPLRGELDRAAFDRILSGRRKQLKALLQEQESIAGIGNAYSDEILHVARLSPLLHAAVLDEAQRERLFDAVISTMADARAARRGIPIDELKARKVAAMRVHGRTGQACPVCGGEVVDVPGSKGTAQYCPLCQSGSV